MNLNFIKMHGCGNDFMVVDARNQVFEPQHIAKWSDYKKSVGFDQFLLIEESKTADVKMRIFNNDGLEVSACGNGTRCIAKLIFTSLHKNTITIETANRILTATLKENLISINMGTGKIIADNVNFDKCSGGFIDVGNPHVVIDNQANYVIEELGPKIENDSRFPEKTNVNFAKILNRSIIELSTWERSVGRTLSCGTGACATFFYFYKKNLLDSEVMIKQKGGDLILSMQDNNIIMSGNAEISYKGILNV